MESKITENHVRRLVSKNLKRLRIMQNKSQLGLALDSGLTHNFINDIENGKKGISGKTLAKLSSALNIEPHQMFLPDDMTSNLQLYVNDFNDSLQRLVQDLTEHYLSQENDG
jgi:transcriptional regulator with XRE-family HTH domain